jgi:hypothetical protein
VIIGIAAVELAGCGTFFVAGNAKRCQETHHRNLTKANSLASPSLIFPKHSPILIASTVPPDSDLQRMAEHPVPEQDDEISKHLTCCSPCFNRYMEILAELRRRKAG